LEGIILPIVNEKFGIDVGSRSTKVTTAQGRDIFQSTIKEGKIDVSLGSIALSYDGKDYTVGNGGRYLNDKSIVDDPAFKIWLLTGILRNTQNNTANIDAKIVTGLPASYYKKQKEETKNMLDGKSFHVEHAGKEKVISIKEAIVFPQSAGIFLLHPEDFKGTDMTLVIDMGGVTIDVSLFRGMELVFFKSYDNMGTYSFFADIATGIQEKFGVYVDIFRIDDMIDKGGVVIDEEVHKFDFSPYFKAYVDQAITAIKNDFDFRTVDKRIFTGGGALRCKDYLPTKRPITENDLYINADAFYKVGEQKFV
jgi:plasmid segregation protein ParM